MHKQRLSASIDAELLEAAESAVARGEAPSVSAWVNDALRAKLEHERRLKAMAAFIEFVEAEEGEITPEEMEQAARRARSRAVVVRGRPAKPAPRVRRRGRRR